MHRDGWHCSGAKDESVYCCCVEPDERQGRTGAGDVGFCALGKAEDVGFGKVQATSGVEDPTVGAQPLPRAPAARRGCAAQR
jgi:hypothetical protein